MGRQTTLGDFQQGDHDELVVAYRHDVHKLLGRTHDKARDYVRGVTVNDPVPYGADRDAAALSRPPGAPEVTLPAHQQPYRLSLLSGESQYDPDLLDGEVSTESFNRLVAASDPEQLHAAWLASDVASRFNEAVAYPYTSLKYHTLLVGALLANYRAGHSFEDLQLVVDTPSRVVPFRTVYADDRFALRVDSTADGGDAAQLGSDPWRSWASTWGRLGTHPLSVDGNRVAMIRDANLRRIQSWSTALQYLEDSRPGNDHQPADVARDQ